MPRPIDVDGHLEYSGGMKPDNSPKKTLSYWKPSFLSLVGSWTLKSDFELRRRNLIFDFIITCTGYAMRLTAPLRSLSQQPLHPAFFCPCQSIVIPFPAAKMSGIEIIVEVFGAVSALVSIFKHGHSLYRDWKVARRTENLDQSLTLGERQVQNEYNRYFSSLGARFASGDGMFVSCMVD